MPRARNRFIPARDLDVVVARHFLAPAVRNALGDVETGAKLRAPDGKMWLSMRDDRVRPSHVDADGQVVPANLRFHVGSEQLREPRDPNGSLGETVNCRCEPVVEPNAVRETIKATSVTVVGTRVGGQVVCTFPRADESEFGTDLDAPARFMGGALNAVRLRTG